MSRYTNKIVRFGAPRAHVPRMQTFRCVRTALHESSLRKQGPIPRAPSIGCGVWVPASRSRVYPTSATSLVTKSRKPDLVRPGRRRYVHTLAPSGRGEDTADASISSKPALSSWMLAGLLILFGAAGSVRADSTTGADIANYTAPDRQRMLEEGARREGELVLYTTGTQTRPLMDRFSQKYPFIK